MRSGHHWRRPFAGPLGAAALLLLGAGSAFAISPADPYVALLREWAHGDGAAASVFLHLLDGGAAAHDLSGGAGPPEPSQEQIMGRLLVQVASENWTIINESREAYLEDLLHDFDHQLSAYGHELSGEQRREIVNFARGQGQDGAGAVLERAYGPLAAAAEQFGLRILSLNDGAPCYKIALVTPEIYQRWIGYAFSPELRVEDGGAPFAAQLANTLYARFLQGPDATGGWEATVQ